MFPRLKRFFVDDLAFVDNQVYIWFIFGKLKLNSDVVSFSDFK